MTMVMVLRIARLVSLSLIVALAAFLFIVLRSLPLLLSTLVSAGMTLWLAVDGWKKARRFWMTFPRDISGLYALIKCKLLLAQCRRQNATVPMMFQKTAKKWPDRVAMYYKEEAWTFRQLDEYSNRVANVFAELGFHPGEEVALFMNSKPEFVGIWLGLAKAGLVTAFINTNQRLDTLVHSITVVNCRAVIYEEELSSAIAEIVPLIQAKNRPMLYFSAYQQTSSSNPQIPSRSLDQLLADASPKAPTTINKSNFNDKLYYIYTSGTTGLPKAVVIRHHRYFWMGVSVRMTLRFRSDDVFYLSLPLYHNNAGTIGTAQALVFGNSLVIREKFSASRFWDDCIKYNCTGAMYIGEICRYLLAQPERPTDRQHKVRIMFGNGLRAKIWRDFQTRFDIKQIGEFYGATEGNANVVNLDNHEGSCGFLPQCIGRFCHLFFPLSLIKVDQITGEPIRNAKGLCQLAKPGETGEIVGKIIETDPSRAFSGYANEEASRKKILRDVFRKGDAYFSSGDLMVTDRFGYLYFRDRTGDTYRWKGENVSTTEVEAVIQRLSKLTDCVVFGVEVPNCEGKAGMAVIAAGQDIAEQQSQSVPVANGHLSPLQADPVDIDNFASVLQMSLPPFAVPIFVRIAQRIDLTGSFKLSKTSLVREGFNPSVIKDPIYFLDKKFNRYVRLDKRMHEQLLTGQISL